MRRPTPDPSASLRLAGAVDLSALARPAPPAAAPSAAPDGDGAAVIDVTEQSFATDVVERSRQVPVVLDFWAEWCGPCKQLSPVLERFAAEDGGAWVLAKVDCDAQPRLAQAAGVQGIPAVKAVVGGQVVAEFTGAVPAAQLRQWLDQVVAVGQQAGLPGPGAAATPDGAPAEPPADPHLDAAEEALGAGNLEAAAEAFRGKLAEVPNDPDATRGLAYTELLLRVQNADGEAAQRRLAADPADVGAACDLADVLLAQEAATEAFTVLVEAVRRTSGADRERARAHLVSLFAVVGDDDPSVPAARRALSAALF